MDNLVHLSCFRVPLPFDVKYTCEFSMALNITYLLIKMKGIYKYQSAPQNCDQNGGVAINWRNFTTQGLV